MNEPIGKVTATQNKPSTCTTVSFWLRPDVILRPFDIVRIKHLPRSGETEPSRSYAIVKEMSYITDSQGHLSSYVSSDFGTVTAQPMNVRLGTTVVEADILRNDKNIEMPIQDGAEVEWADETEIRTALGIRDLKKPIPAGVINTSNGVNVSIDFEARYLLGPEAAHLNISGISGLASKTSYAMFILSAIQQKLAQETSIVLFNVKGCDLLAVDRMDPDLSNSTKAEWEQLGLEAKPLENVRFIYPFRADQEPWMSSAVPPDWYQDQLSRGVTSNYYYTVESFLGCEDDGEEVTREKLSLLFSDVDDPSNTMESCIHELGQINADTWEDLRSQVQRRTQKGNKGEIAVGSWRKFSRYLRRRTSHSLFSEPFGGKVDKHQSLLADELARLKKGQVLVIDIAQLEDHLQCLVVGDTIRTLFNIKLGFGNRDATELGTVLMFADELNKYAPAGSGKDRTLSRWLLDVTERGRQFSVVLFGAEQFRSGIQDRVLGNCGTNVYGRTNPVELQKGADYRHFSATNKSAILHLPPGHMLLQHSAFSTPLIKARFPYPAYLTKKG